mmetsp:Transcript_47798/g.58749  ORF Transcript_47798/g.58749 Transcript_47798/m.58749 type:complete len:229 (-) Transcript_47798:170-856(-)
MVSAGVSISVFFLRVALLGHSLILPSAAKIQRLHSTAHAITTQTVSNSDAKGHQLLWTDEEKNDGSGQSTSRLRSCHTECSWQVVPLTSNDKNSQGDCWIQIPTRNLAAGWHTSDQDEANGQRKKLIPQAPGISPDGGHAVQGHQAVNGTVNTLNHTRIEDAIDGLGFFCWRLLLHQDSHQSTCCHPGSNLQHHVFPNPPPIHFPGQAKGKGHCRIQMTARHSTGGRN